MNYISPELENTGDPPESSTYMQIPSTNSTTPNIVYAIPVSDCNNRDEYFECVDNSLVSLEVVSSLD